MNVIGVEAWTIAKDTALNDDYASSLKAPLIMFWIFTEYLQYHDKENTISILDNTMSQLRIESNCDHTKENGSRIWAIDFNGAWSNHLKQRSLEKRTQRWIL